MLSPNLGILVRRSSDREFLRDLLTNWANCIARYHDFHSPESSHQDHGLYVWDSVVGQIERSQVSVLVSAAWMSGGVGLAEISLRTEKKREETNDAQRSASSNSTTRYGDFYLCSPHDIAFEGECKRTPITINDRENTMVKKIKSTLNEAQKQHEDLLRKDYEFTPMYIAFVQISGDESQAASETFNRCISAISRVVEEPNVDLGDEITAFAFCETKSAVPVKWDKKFHAGSIICIRECAPIPATEMAE